jgi:hypothetical protein
LLQYPHRLLWYTSDSSPGHMSEFKTLMQTSANRGGEGGTWRPPVHGAAEGVADHLRRHPLGLRLAGGGGGDSKLARAPRLRSDEDPLDSRSDPAHGCAPAPRTEALKASESLEEYQG